MKSATRSDYSDYQQYLDNIYTKELGSREKFSMITSLTPAILSNEEVQGFINRYNTIKKFWQVSQELFKEGLMSTYFTEIRDLVLNEVNPQFALAYHKELYNKEVSCPLFFRTDESAPGKICEIQSPGSGWGTLQALQTSLSFLKKFISSEIRPFNEVYVAENVARVIKQLTMDNPLIFHQIDESSVMLDTNYFISVTRKYGLKYLGHDYEVNYKNANFIRTHSFMEEVSSSIFFEFLNRYYKRELIFDTFPSILFFQKISLVFPFWKKTKHLYSDDIREIFPYTALVTDDLLLEDNTRMTIEEFCNRKPHERDYYLKYAGADGTLNWGSKAIYHLGKTDWKKCKLLLQSASAGYHHNHYWILQKAQHKKERVSSIQNGTLNTQELYAKWSGFYGANGFLGGYVMNRGFYKVHGQDNTICRLLL